MAKFYRFKDGTFIESRSFEEAKEKRIALIQAEEYGSDRWSNCNCTGLEHRMHCPEKKKQGIHF